MSATATIDKTEHKTRRAELQQRLNDREKFKAAMDRAAEELAAAQSLVTSHQRTATYTADFERSFATHAAAFNDLNSTIPNQLVNSCRDRDLKDQFEVALSIRSGAIADHQDAMRILKRAEQELESTKIRIAVQRGEPAILKQGDSMPWGEGFLQKTFTKMQIAMGHVEVPTWAITEDRQTIAFGPSVHSTDVEFYSQQWSEGLREVRMAKTTHDSAERRLKAAGEALQEVKQRMIWSLI